MLANMMHPSIAVDEVIGFVDIGAIQITIAVSKVDLRSGSFKMLGQLKRGFLPVLQDDNVPYNLLVLMIDEIESTMHCSIEKIVMSINAKHIQSVALSISSQFDVPVKISAFTVRNLLQKAIKYYSNMADSKIILDLSFHHYILDKMIRLSNPLDTIAQHIAAKVNIIATRKSTLERLNHHMSSCRMHVVHYIPTAEAAALAYMNEHELHNPTLLIHLGASAVDMVLYRDGNMQYIDHIAFAGRAITQDIAREFAISLQDAERLKTKLGSIYILDNTIIDISEMLDSVPYSIKEIRSHDVIKIIKQRLKEIVIAVKEKFESQTRRKLTELAGIVLTGGVAKTIDIDIFFRSILGVNCRVGTHKNNDVGVEPLMIGMILYLIRQHKQMMLYQAQSSSLKSYCYKFACFLERLFS